MYDAALMLLEARIASMPIDLFPFYDANTESLREKKNPTIGYQEMEPATRCLLKLWKARNGCNVLGAIPETGNAMSKQVR